MKLILLFLFVSLILGQPFFIPTSYDTFKPQPYQARDVINYRASFCANNHYLGCFVNTTVNLPLDAWSYIDGRFVQFQIVSDVDGCARVLCSNNPSSNGPDATSCSFLYNTALINTRSLYVITQSGPSPDITVTVNMDFTCPNEIINNGIQIQEIEKRDVQQPSQCPITTQFLKEVIQLSYTSSVLTSPNYADATKFYFFICGDGSHRYSATATTIGSTIDSATATYVCTQSPCTPVSSPYYDASGTGLNTVIFQTSTFNPIEFWVTIYGWGKYKQLNHFNFGVNIANIS
jgi:hypothetical protein